MRQPKSGLVIGFLKSIYYTAFPTASMVLKKELTGCNTVLDLGCGRYSYILLSDILSSMELSVGVELFEPYLNESKRNKRHSQYIQADVRRIEFKPMSFDAVVAIELLEHLTKEEGIILLDKMKRWAKKKVIITTPNGYICQDAYDNNSFQVHKCGWSTKELRELGFKVFGLSGWRRLRGNQALLRYRPIFLWTVISDLTQMITYHCPKIAFALLAIKEV